MVIVVSFCTICQLVFISEVKLKVPYAKHRFWRLLKTVSIFDLWRSFKPKRKPRIKGVKRCTVSHRYDNICFTLCDKTDWVMANYKIWPAFWHGGVINDFKSLQHITCTTRHSPIFLQNITDVAPVIHNWTARANIVTNKQTQTHRVKTLSLHHRGW